MSKSVKLIIEIPTDLYEITKDKVDKNMTYAPLSVSIAHGIPLDSVKAEIVDKAIKDANGEGFIFLGRLLRIFDNIGKAEHNDNLICAECECKDECDGIEYMSKDQCEKKRGWQ